MSAGFRRFSITRKVPESSIITSFYLAPCDGEPVWDASPGQYLTLRIPDAENTLLKTYSISTEVTNTTETRITVKRELAPAHLPDVPDGQGSSWLHDHASPGTEIEIAAPRGSFVLDEHSSRPVILLSGGVGQTPLLSMLHALANSNRPVWYLHACENGEVHAMHEEVEALVTAAKDRIHSHVCYRNPTDADHCEQHFDSSGLIDKSLLQSLLPIDDYDCYLCGPTAFMVAIYRLLVSLGILENRISYEFFGKATSLPALAKEAVEKNALAGPLADKETTQACSRAPAALAGLEHLTDPDARAASDKVIASTQQYSPHTQLIAGDESVISNSTDVVFVRSGVSAQWSDKATSLLELAEQSGLTPTFSCRSGICNTCVCRIREGEVEYFEEPLQEPDPGTVLICCSRPRGRVVLEL